MNVDLESCSAGGMVEITLASHALLSNSQVQGAQAELYVKQVLLRHGWRLLEHNWSCRYGEIDLLFIKKSLQTSRILVVEVKARRRSGLDGWGVAAFHQAKRRCLARTVDCWRAANAWSEASCFEVVLALVALALAAKGKAPLKVTFVGKAATFNLLYAFPFLLLALSDSWYGTAAFIFGWAFAIWGVTLYVGTAVGYFRTAIKTITVRPHIIEG